MNSNQKPQIFLHTSDIRRFKTCRRQWKYASPLGYNKVPRKTPAPFTRGKTVHKGMEALYIDKTDPVETAVASYIEAVAADRRNGATYEVEEIQDQIAVLESVLGMYPAWAKKNDDFKVLEAEKRYSVPLIETNDFEVFFTFRCDQIVERRSGLWIHDFKTVTDLPSDPSFLDYDDQITGYLKGCELQFGKPFVGAIFTYLLAKVPSEPEVLQKGGLSTNKKIFTTAEVYYRKLLELGLDPRDYQDFLKQLNARCKWFVRFDIMKTRAEKDLLWAEHQQLAYEMLKPDVFIYKAPTKMNCNYCSYKTPCLIENAGRDFERVLELEFVNGQEW